MTELEARDVPALYAVTLLGPAAGELGDTDASHVGELRINPTLSTYEGEQVIGAATPADAIRAALTGTVTASAGDRSASYHFGRDTAGLLTNDHKPYHVEVSGTEGRIWLEDLAELPGSDWDYNDRSWRVSIRQLSSGGSGGGGSGGGVGILSLIDSGQFTWTNQFGETATADYEVTEYAPDIWLWQYTVTNNNLSKSSPPPQYGVTSVEIPAAAGAGVFDVRVESGVTNWHADPAYPFWYRDSYAGSYLTPGQTAVFTFKTPPVPILSVTATAPVAARIPSIAEGPAKGPGEQPKVIIADSAGNQVPDDPGLKVAKWQDAFKLTADGKGVEIKGPDAGTNWDFIDRDPDRFNVWVKDPVKWNAMNGGNPANPHVEVKITAVNIPFFTLWDDAATAVDLVRYTGNAKNETGWYWSDSQMLVSNNLDDDHTEATYLGADEIGPGADALPKNGYTWKVSDRTHMVALGATVKAEYMFAPGAVVTDDAPVKVKKNVKVHVTILRDKKAADGGTPVIAESTAKADLFRANEQYAQVGIQLVPTFQTVDPPAGVDLSNGLDEYPGLGPDGKIAITDEEVALLVPALRTAETDDIELYYVNSLSGGSTGESFPASVVPNVRYEDSVIFSATKLILPGDTREPFAVPHEIGHILTDADHFTGTLAWINLMVEQPSTVDSVEASKRLTPAQQTAIVGDPNTNPPTPAKRPNLLTDP